MGRRRRSPRFSPRAPVAPASLRALHPSTTQSPHAHLSRTGVPAQVSIGTRRRSSTAQKNSRLLKRREFLPRYHPIWPSDTARREERPRQPCCHQRPTRRPLTEAPVLPTCASAPLAGGGHRTLGRTALRRVQRQDRSGFQQPRLSMTTRAPTAPRPRQSLTALLGYHMPSALVKSAAALTTGSSRYLSMIGASSGALTKL